MPFPNLSKAFDTTDAYSTNVIQITHKILHFVHNFDPRCALNFEKLTPETNSKSQSLTVHVFSFLDKFVNFFYRESYN